MTPEPETAKALKAMAVLSITTAQCPGLRVFPANARIGLLCQEKCEEV